MLMRIREQKGWIRGIFVALILVFASSFVIGGVGSGSNFSLSDIIGNNSSGTTTTNSTDVKSLLTQLKVFMGQLDTNKDQIVRAIESLNRLAISIKPALTAGCSGCSGNRTVSCLMTPPSFISALQAIRPHWRFS